MDGAEEVGVVGVTGLDQAVEPTGVADIGVEAGIFASVGAGAGEGGASDGGAVGGEAGVTDGVERDAGVAGSGIAFGEVGGEGFRLGEGLDEEDRAGVCGEGGV